MAQYPEPVYCRENQCFLTAEFCRGVLLSGGRGMTDREKTSCKKETGIL